MQRNIVQKKIHVICYNTIVSVTSLLLVTLCDLRMSYDIMLAYSIHSAVVFANLLYLEIKYFDGLNLNLPLLVGWCFRLVFPAITSSWGAINGEKYFFLLEENVINDYMFPTVIWMNIYYMIFYWSFVYFKSKYTVEDSIKPLFKKISIPKFSIPLFVIGIIYKIIISFIPYEMIPSIFTSIFGKFTLLAIFAQMFDALFSNKKSKRRLFLIFIIVSTWESIVYGFYKGDIMMNFVYYAIFCFLDSRYNGTKLLNQRLIITCLSIFLIIDLVIYPFMTTKRVVAGWSSNEGGVAKYEYSNWDILVDVLQGKSLSERGENKTSDRLNAIPANAFFYGECCKKGLRTSEILINNIELLVPRFINPNKHSSQAGMMVFSYATTGSFNNIHLASSNNYIGQFASAYLIGGWFTAILFAFITGCFFIYYYDFLIRNDRNYISIMFLLSLLLDALVVFEESCDGGALLVGYNIFIMLGIIITSKFAPGIFCLNK